VPDSVESFFDVQKDGGCAQFAVRICCQLVDEADKLVGCGVLWMEANCSFLILGPIAALSFVKTTRSKIFEREDSSAMGR